MSKAQQVTTTTTDQARELQAQLQKVNGRMPAEAKILIAEATRGEPNRVAITMYTHELAKRGSLWKRALEEFASTDAGTGWLVKAVMIGLRMGDASHE